MKISKKKESAAYHEASHVVIAVRCGLNGVRAYITDNESDHDGRMEYFNPFRDSNPVIEEYENPEVLKKKIESKIMVCLAGPLGQKKFDPIGFRKYHADGDWSEAAEYALRLGVDDITRLEDRAKQMINDPDIWADIEKVAMALIEKEVLQDWQIEEMLQTSTSK